MPNYRFPQTILATCCIPWADDLSFEAERFRGALVDLVANGLDELYIFGTAGEGYAVTDSQFTAITEAFVRTMDDLKRQPMVGIISTSLTNIQERIRTAVAIGARRIQISLPPWAVLTDGEVDEFFAQVCDRHPDVNFLHYNLSRSGRLLGPNDYQRLALRHPNLVAVKHSRADYSTAQRLVADDTGIRHFFTEQTFAYASQFGACGFLISVASINPGLARRFFEAGVDNDPRILRRLAIELRRITEWLLEANTGGAHIDGAFDKVFARIRDSAFPLHLLPPYQAYGDSNCDQFRQMVADELPHWLIDGET